MKQSEKENTCVQRDIDGKIWKQRGGCGAPAGGNTGSIPLDCTGLSRFPEVNFRKNSFHSGEISHTLRPRFQHAASAAGESGWKLAAYECPQEAPTHELRSRYTLGPAVHEYGQEAPMYGKHSGHMRTRRAQMDTKSPRRGTGGFSCDFVLSFVDVYVITSRSRPLCFRGSCSP